MSGHMGCFSKNVYKKTSTRNAPVVFVTPCIGTLGGEATVFVPEDSNVRWESKDCVELLEKVRIPVSRPIAI